MINNYVIMFLFCPHFMSHPCKGHHIYMNEKNQTDDKNLSFQSTFAYCFVCGIIDSVTDSDNRKYHMIYIN